MFNRENTCRRCFKSACGSCGKKLENVKYKKKS